MAIDLVLIVETQRELHSDNKHQKNIIWIEPKTTKDSSQNCHQKLKCIPLLSNSLTKQ